MSISSIVSSGLQSMQAGINRSASASSRVAEFSIDTESSAMAASMVGLRQGANDVKIAANVIKTGDEILGTLLDIRA